MSFHYQKLIKLQHKIAIISALYENDKRFGELLQETDLSKTILAKRLKELQDSKKVNWLPDLETKMAKYQLVNRNLDQLEKAGLILEILAKRKLDHLRELSKKKITPNDFFIEYSNTLIDIMILRMNFFRAASTGIFKEYIKIAQGHEVLKNIDLVFSKPMIPKTLEILEEEQSEGRKFDNNEDQRADQEFLIQSLKNKLKDEFHEDIIF